MDNIYYNPPYCEESECGGGGGGAINFEDAGDPFGYIAQSNDPTKGVTLVNDDMSGAIGVLSSDMGSGVVVQGGSFTTFSSGEITLQSNDDNVNISGKTGFSITTDGETGEVSVEGVGGILNLNAIQGSVLIDAETVLVNGSPIAILAQPPVGTSTYNGLTVQEWATEDEFAFAFGVDGEAVPRVLFGVGEGGIVLTNGVDEPNGIDFGFPGLTKFNNGISITSYTPDARVTVENGGEIIIQAGNVENQNHGVLIRASDGNNNSEIGEINIEGARINLRIDPVGVDQGVMISAPQTPPDDAFLPTSGFTVWLNEAGNELTFRVMFADGTTVKTGTVALT